PIRPSETLPNPEINPTLLSLDYTSLGGTTVYNDPIWELLNLQDLDTQQQTQEELSLSLEPISYTNTCPDTESSAEIPPQNSVQGATTTGLLYSYYGSTKFRTKT
ncbi:hypothetical protein ACRALDRAFT_1070440, partial [Sodiomyces alcalophilus JCM 7366]|uniref:uncharacterized protein n=1 Tax=Sodiomyces alcalophilus JCM 7366 TaxID=591952 RepID=UPI0039B5547E